MAPQACPTPAAQVCCCGVLPCPALQVAGGEGESVVLPQWGPDGSLYFVSDAPDGWWNLFVRGPEDKVRAGVWKQAGSQGS